jgi:hypothetical protein
MCEYTDQYPASGYLSCYDHNTMKNFASCAYLHMIRAARKLRGIERQRMLACIMHSVGQRRDVEPTCIEDIHADMLLL